MHREHSYSLGPRGSLPIENLLGFLDFFFEFLLVGIIQVPRFSGQTRSVFAG